MTSKRDFSTTPLQPAAPDVGFDVFTVDGMPVGTVSEIDGGFMRVDAHLRPDFWLRLDDATTVEGHSVTLAYPKEALPHHKHSGPATTSEDFPPTGADPVLLDEAEQLAQREAMERDLEEQRRRLARASAVSTTAEWEREQRAGARVAGIVIVSAAMAAVAATVLTLGRMRRRRRRAAAQEPSPAPPAAAEMPDMRH